MKRFFVAIAFLLSIASVVFAQADEINIMPTPQSIVRGEGSFTFDKSTKIVAMDDVGRASATVLNEHLFRNYGFRLKVANKPERKNAFDFLPQFVNLATDLTSEQYVLNITPEKVYIGGLAVGHHFAIQSLLQLLPSEVKKAAKLPVARIADEPRFPYRGMHLDVARHFMPVEFVKKYIDLMSQYKFNYFHWHLTEDQGWRIEIKKYPGLTEVGSKRPETMKERNFAPYIGDGIPHGGFYTQEQIKEVVKYAKERYITVIPEIELPGHASAALAAYPQFGCKADYKYKVQTTWGIFKEVFCPTEETFKFLEDVLDETIKLFPDSPYVHIGGDEVLKDHWKESAFVQDLMKRENLKDEHEVQSYFVRRIEKFINSKGKKMIGWDEILEGGLAPNATVMSWRGMKGGIESAKAKHDVIMTPTDYVYFDYGQGDPAYEPLNIGSYVPLDKVYSFEPVPIELTPDEAKYIIGGQANIWTEYMKTPSHVEYMAFPRMLALSEVLWSRKEDRNLDDFQRRLNAILPRLDKQGVKYRIPEPGGLRNIVTDREKVKIELEPAPGTRVHFTTDGSTPDERSAAYKNLIEVVLKPEEIVTLKTVVVNSAGRKSSIYAATILRGVMREALTPGETKPGVRFRFAVNETEGFRAEGESQSIALSQFSQKADLKKAFEVRFDGYLKVPADGIYEFEMDSTWDASISVSDVSLINATGTKDRAVRSAIIPLKAGLHKFNLFYIHRGGDPAFRARYGIKGQGLRGIGGGDLVY